VSGLSRLLAAGITARQVDHWVRKGYLRPYHEGGTGNPREWPVRELAIAKLMKRLIEVGFTPATAAEVARQAETIRPLYSLSNTDPIPVDLGGGLTLTIAPAGAMHGHVQETA
jgi:DNA-binding transcriptional MerR regulator